MKVKKRFLAVPLLFGTGMAICKFLKNKTRINKHKKENLSYEEKKKLVIENFHKIKSKKIKLKKNDTHIYKVRSNNDNNLDLTFLNKVIHIDLEKEIVYVEGLMTFNDLLDYTLKFNYIPLVTPEFRTLTVGGVISGVGLESSSFKYGLFHDTVTEYEVLTGEGKIIKVNINNNSDLFNGIPNSYGTFGYIISAKLKIIKCKPYVKVSNLKFSNSKKFIEEIINQKNKLDIDFFDGQINSKNELYLMKAKMISEKPKILNKYDIDIYYKSISKIRTDYMTIKDYIWRYDSNFFYYKSVVTDNKLFRNIFKNYLDSYKLKKLSQISLISKLFDKDSSIEKITNDISIELNQFSNFFEWYNKKINVYPVWICPYKTVRDTTFEKGNSYCLDFGIGFGVGKKSNKKDKFYYRKLIDEKLYAIKRPKGLYSKTILTEDKYWEMYGPKDNYFKLKNKYDPRNKFYNSYDKVILDI